MNKRSQIALASCGWLSAPENWYCDLPHPVGAVVVFVILTVFSVIGGASASDVVHATSSFAGTSGRSPSSGWPSRGVG